MRLWEAVPLTTELTQAALASAGLPPDGKEAPLQRVILVEENQDSEWVTIDTITRWGSIRPMFNALRNHWLRNNNRITIFINEDEHEHED